MAEARQRLAAVPELQTSAMIDSHWLLAFVLDKSQAWLRTWPEASLASDQYLHFQQLLARRQAGEPVAYLTGQQGFRELLLQVTPDTLVPRPETELLVELAIQALPQEQACSVLDMGTGSGAIALAIKQERPFWQVVATDVYEPTLAVAKANAKAHDLALSFTLSDWFQQLAEDKSFDLIVSNPPYIADQDPHLRGVGVRFEPHRALASGVVGLDAIEHLIEQAPGYLAAGGWMLLEHGHDQAAAIRQRFAQRGFQQISSHTDLSGIERVTGGRWEQ